MDGRVEMISFWRAPLPPRSSSFRLATESMWCSPPLPCVEGDSRRGGRPRRSSSHLKLSLFSGQKDSSLLQKAST
ncbi:hypothetical protein CSUI_010998 [Cystoisospora suis]|uniref:Uncharacterized protein n=1 Tax=Cystoisospora suis TaxID=483139 RepID=A0A2C6KF51_9APIC|nr:hypothetical protein CSUI_010998 [Cystoisospora suis]